MEHNVPKLNDPSLLKTNVAYVNGEWVKAKSGKSFEVFGELFSLSSANASFTDMFGCLQTRLRGN